MKLRYIVAAAFASLAVVSGCSLQAPFADASATGSAAYEHISQEEAQAIMDGSDSIIILDVRRQDEYEEAHIPGAICIPNETINESVIEQLPNKEQEILVYCRSGRRSKEASNKLAQLGYTNIKEFGGIMTWTGNTVSGPLPYEEELVSMLEMVIGDQKVEVAWEENDAVNALKDLVAQEPLTVQMSMYGGFEQVGHLGTTLPSQDVDTVTQAGDIVLYASNQIVVFYGSNSWAYTRLGHVTSEDAQGMAELLSNGDVTITLSLVQAPKQTFDKEALAGTYVFEQEGFGGDFTITLLPDGTYSFSEGGLSSYLGTGTWDIIDSQLVLTENREAGFDLTNRFDILDNGLGFVADGSSNFPYIKVEDGQRFIKQ